MKRLLVLAAVGFALTAAATPSQAAPIVLTFEGVGNQQPVGNFYNGGAGGNLGISFGTSALGIVDSDAGGTGNFGGEPSPSTALFFLQGSAVMNVSAGFTTGFSFFYSAVNVPGSVTVYAGLNATGAILAQLVLPVTPSNGGDPNGNFSPFFPIGVAFAGTARSVDFSGTVNQIAFDDVTIGAATPGPAVPEPASLAVFGALTFGAFGLRRRLKPATAA